MDTPSQELTAPSLLSTADRAYIQQRIMQIRSLSRTDVVAGSAQIIHLCQEYPHHVDFVRETLDNAILSLGS